MRSSSASFSQPDWVRCCSAQVISQPARALPPRLASNGPAFSQVKPVSNGSTLVAANSASAEVPTTPWTTRLARRRTPA